MIQARLSSNSNSISLSILNSNPISNPISFSNSILIISALAGKKEDDWILPNGRQILENQEIKKFTISDRSKIIFEK
mgnify:CR=1 FL=1